MSNWIVNEVAKVKEWFAAETTSLKSRVRALEVRLAAMEAAAVKPATPPSMPL